MNILGPDSPWHELEPLPGKARILPVAASFEDAFYVFGGVALEPKDGKVSRVYLRDAWQYRLGKGWRRLMDAPRPVAAAPSPAPVSGGEILLLGGDDGSRVAFQPVERHPGFPAQSLAYDPRRDGWREWGPIPAPRATVPCVEWRGSFVIPSGEVRPGVRSPEVWSLRLKPAKLTAP
jgi:N-acetylneuraminate epimerase